MPDIPLQPSEKTDIYSLGFNKSLNRAIEDNSTGVVYDTIENSLNTGSVLSGGNLSLKTLSIGGLVRQVAPGDDIQAAIDAVSREGGGTVQLLAKRYELYTRLSLRSRVSIVGAGVGNTVLDFMGVGGGFDAEGLVRTNTGTDITATEGSAVVTGTGTTFTLASSGDYISIRGVWYEIRSVTNDTSLTLVDTYTDNTFAQGAILIADIIQDVKITSLSIHNSSSDGLAFRKVKGVTIDSVEVKLADSDGVFIDSSSNCLLTNVTTSASGNNGFFFIDLASSSLDNCIGKGSTDSGFLISNNSYFIIPTSFVQCIASGSGADGFDITNLEHWSFLGCTATDNDGDGMDFSNSQQVAVVGCTLRGNGLYGIAMTTFNEGQISGNSFADNTSGDIHIDSGSDNLIWGNSHQASSELTTDKSIVVDDGNYNYILDNRIPITQQQEMTKMKNTSGGSLEEGVVVVIGSAASGTEVTTTTTNGDNKVIGMATAKLGGFSNNSYGDVLTRGKTDALYVNNSAASISIGDHLSTYSHAYYAKKATAGETVFAISLESPTTGTAQIDALLISPRLI